MWYKNVILKHEVDHVGSSREMSADPHRSWCCYQTVAITLLKGWLLFYCVNATDTEYLINL